MAAHESGLAAWPRCVRREGCERLVRLGRRNRQEIDNRSAAHSSVKIITVEQFVLIVLFQDIGLCVCAEKYAEWI